MMVENTTRSTVLGDRIAPANNPWARARGLLGKSGLKPGEGLHIIPCKSVHMLFMRFSIDVLYLDREGRVVKAVPNLGLFRYSWGGWSAHSALELPAGTIAASSTVVGDKLNLQP